MVNDCGPSRRKPQGGSGTRRLVPSRARGQPGETYRDTVQLPRSGPDGYNPRRPAGSECPCRRQPAVASDHRQGGGPAGGPVLPAEVVAAMQEGRLDEATACLTAGRPGQDGRRDGLLFPDPGIGERLAGHGDARRTLGDALKARAEGPMGGQDPLRAGRRRTRRQADTSEAEVLARAEAETLLAGDRKDRLAEVYHAFARRFLKPDDPIAQPDPNAAYELLVQARDLAKGEPSAPGSCSRWAGRARPPVTSRRAIENFQAYLKDYPRGPTAPPLASTWAKPSSVPADPGGTPDLDRPGPRPRPKPGRLREIARAIRAWPLRDRPTFGIPNPPDDTSLNLGVAALRRFLAAFPASGWAVRPPTRSVGVPAGQEPGGAGGVRGSSRKRTSGPSPMRRRKISARLSMSATFLVGQIL